MQFRQLVCSDRSRIWRICVLISAMLAIILMAGRAEAGPTTTTVTDIVYRADGSPAAGTLLISWPAFVTADGKAVAAGSMSLAIGPSGSVMLALAPNEGATPAGTYYKVVLKLNDGSTSTEYWSVPAKGPASVSQIRTMVVPQSVAIQTASRQYVDSTLTAKADNSAVVHNTGDEQISGVKAFAVSPTVPMPTLDTAAANKLYVDNAVSSINTSDYLQKSGDTMTGALTLAGDPTSSNQAANRHYVDLQIAGVNSAVSQKLARQGDTPITMAGVRYASQFASIQAAIADAGTNGAVVIPPDYSGTDGFTNPNNIRIQDQRGDASGNTGVYNVRDFGAIPNDGQDDWAAIQAAIDAASVGSYPPYGAVYLPRGIYQVSKPLHVYRGIRFFGSGRASTTITGYSADQGPVLVVSPPTSLGYTGVPTGPSLATGAGNSMYLDGTYSYLLNLREAGAVELNGRTALTIEFYYKPNQSVSVGAYNIIASSGRATGLDQNTAVAVQHSSQDSISVILTVAGVARTIASPANAVTAGNVYHIAFTYDGTSMRLFINGAQAASAPASGAITQLASEDFVIGPQSYDFLESTFATPMAKGWIDSVRISNNARYTSNFTTPTAKFSYDGNTLFLLNFDNNFDQFTQATTVYGNQYLFIHRFGGGMGQVGNFELADMSFIGTGPEFMYMISSTVDNIWLTPARRGLHFVNNCYLNRLTSVTVTGQASTQFDLAIGAASGVLTFNDLSLSAGQFPLYVDTASVAINGLWVEMSTGTLYGALLKGNTNTSIAIQSPIFSAETGPASIKSGVAEVGVGALSMNGGSIQTSAGAPAVAVYGGGSIVQAASSFAPAGTLPSSIYHIVAPPTNPVQLLAPLQEGMNVPWSDNLAWVQTAPVKTGQNCTGFASGIDSNGNLVCNSAPGYTLTLASTGANAPANSTSYFFGGNILDYNNTSFDTAKIEVPKSGTIKRIYIRQNLPAGSTGSTESVVHKICINSSTNCFGNASFAYNGTSTAGSDATLNQPVSAGDTIAVQVNTPNWVTKPTGIRWYALVYIE